MYFEKKNSLSLSVDSRCLGHCYTAFHSLDTSDQREAGGRCFMKSGIEVKMGN